MPSRGVTLASTSSRSNVIRKQREKAAQLHHPSHIFVKNRASLVVRRDELDDITPGLLSQIRLHDESPQWPRHSRVSPCSVVASSFKCNTLVIFAHPAMPKPCNNINFERRLDSCVLLLLLYSSFHSFI